MGKRHPINIVSVAVRALMDGWRVDEGRFRGVFQCFHENDPRRLARRPRESVTSFSIDVEGISYFD
jgi:hypothetical protein